MPSLSISLWPLHPELQCPSPEVFPIDISVHNWQAVSTNKGRRPIADTTYDTWLASKRRNQGSKRRQRVSRFKFIVCLALHQLFATADHVGRYANLSVKPKILFAFLTPLSDHPPTMLERIFDVLRHLGRLWRVAMMLIRNSIQGYRDAMLGWGLRWIYLVKSGPTSRRAARIRQGCGRSKRRNRASRQSAVRGSDYRAPLDPPKFAVPDIQQLGITGSSNDGLWSYMLRLARYSLIKCYSGRSYAEHCSMTLIRSSFLDKKGQCPPPMRSTLHLSVFTFGNIIPSNMPTAGSSVQRRYVIGTSRP